MLNENSFKDLKANLRGGLIEPSDKGYDEARKVYNGMIHKKPRAIARCADVADVIRSVNFARENDLLLAIRSGGHNAGGLGICDDGLVIDLGLIKYTRVDPAGSDRHRRWRMHLGRCRSCHACVWTCYSEWNHFHDRSWRTNSGWRDRAPDPQMRTDASIICSQPTSYWQTAHL